jgi:hypothetical protein
VSPEKVMDAAPMELLKDTLSGVRAITDEKNPIEVIFAAMLMAKVTIIVARLARAENAARALGANAL